MCVVRCVRTDPDFSVDVSCQIKGNEVSFNFVSKIRHLKTRLIGNIADHVQVQVQVEGINQISEVQEP